MLKYLFNKKPMIFKKFRKNIILEIDSKLKEGENPSYIKKQYFLDESEWYRIASKIYQNNLKEARKSEKESSKLEQVNSKLCKFALLFPRLGTQGELDKLSTLLLNYKKNEKEILKLLISTIMHPNMRAMYHLDCYSIPKFNNLDNPVYTFHPIIESAVLSFYRGNYISSYMTIIPVIEGTLLRWQGFPKTIKIKPGFEESLKFLKNSYIRQPVPSLIGFFDTWNKTSVRIIEDHLFKPTSSGKSNIDFNRHLVAHLLYDAQFATVLNITRAFNLIDTLIDIFLNENHNSYHWFNSKHGWIGSQKTETFKIYNSCLTEYFKNKTFEDYLRSNDKIVDLRNYT